jgi:hypothetical protein
MSGLSAENNAGHGSHTLGEQVFSVDLGDGSVTGIREEVTNGEKVRKLTPL